MKLIKTERGRLYFEIAENEKGVLFMVLSLYPMIPPTHQRLSNTEEQPENQELLDAALMNQRKANRRKVLRLLKSKSRFKKHEKALRFSLSLAQFEWLLQVLNNIRVGSWLAMGSPDGPTETLAALNDKTAPHLWAMEMSGQFQAVLLQALKGA